MDGETYPSSRSEEEPRPPRLNDLSRLCAELNRLGAQYLVIGGFAIIQAGFPRFTGDIDLLIDPSLENEAKVFEALRSLPDKAVDQLDAGDVARFTVVRVADDVLVDLMASSCGVTFREAIQDAHFQEVEGVRIPFASPPTLWKMKQTVRDKDIPDRLFLRKLLQMETDHPASDSKRGSGPGWLRKLFRLGKR
jgi:hypothetical protein